MVRHLAIKLDPLIEEEEKATTSFKVTTEQDWSRLGAHAECACSSWTDHGDFQMEKDKSLECYKKKAEAEAPVGSVQNDASTATIGVFSEFRANSQGSFISLDNTTARVADPGKAVFPSLDSGVFQETSVLFGGMCAAMIHLAFKVKRRRQLRSRLEIKQSALERRLIDERRVYYDGSVQDTQGLDIETKSACVVPQGSGVGDFHGRAPFETTGNEGSDLGGGSGALQENPEHAAIFDALDADPCIRTVIFTPQ
jgi:hypothetical protein